MSELLVVLLAMLALSTPAQAQDNTPITLTARPGLCVLKEAGTRQCVMGVALQWQAPRGGYCLYQESTEEPLRCWQDSSGGSHKQALQTANDVTFRLHRLPESDRVAQIKVRVLSLAQKRPDRRRRRHAWAPL